MFNLYAVCIKTGTTDTEKLLIGSFSDQKSVEAKVNEQPGVWINTKKYYPSSRVIDYIIEEV
jgi:hypothetical protein